MRYPPVAVPGSAQPGALFIESRDRGGGGFDSDLRRSLALPLRRLRSGALQAFVPVAHRGLPAARAMAAQLLQVLMKLIVDVVSHTDLLGTTTDPSSRAHKQGENAPGPHINANRRRSVRKGLLSRAGRGGA